ncbi:MULTISPECIES: MFS transporter [Burkholderia]|uniref:MFS transporter n=1 Tax=Burkholderia TaxID=32008 RepID=UPI0009C075E1|nr:MULTISPECIES: MFS transporter [Burkholderia]MBR7914094.1 MFS transporter [Burkholderia vietnamiensis]MBR8003871.1 MFS transporter [Burkholderia vietnamiensis]QMI47563.1 MFS transporter [Burkholderia sp. MBR-1]HDR9025571.1 MFS transporter [Burkholderia vietnamiensis]HDR9083922.1 MFS transporter [Burkholderia vietnamiensis]
MLKNRDFQKFLLGYLFSSFGNYMTPVALTFAMVGQPNGLLNLATVLAARTAPSALLSIFGGWSADSISRKHTIIISDLIRFLSVGAVGIILLKGVQAVPVISAMMFVSGLGQALGRPALGGMTRVLIEDDNDLPLANGQLSAIDSFSGIVGPLAAALLSNRISMGGVVIMDAATFILNALLIALITHNPSRRELGDTKGYRRTLKDIAAGCREFASRKWLVAMTVQISLLQALVSVPFALIGPQLMSSRLHGIELWSAVVSVEGAGALLGSWFAAAVRVKNILFVAEVLVLGTCLPMLTLGLGFPVPILIVASLLFGFCTAVYGVLLDVALQRYVPERVLSRVIAVCVSISVILNPIAFLVTNPLVDTFGSHRLLIFGGWFTLISTAFVLWAVRPSKTVDIYLAPL